MSPAPENPALDTCGCCAGVMAQTPAPVENRPGLSAVAYRVGTHGQFKASLLAALSPAGPAGLGTREDNDFTIALLDAWAVVADVLTFYQERIANEQYWRTATERRSLLELARLLGYELRPGVAASTYLAFTLETATGAPDEVSLDAGIKVQSLPGPGETPQTFETIEPLDAKGVWNRWAAQATMVIPPAAGDKAVVFQGAALNLKVGDGLLLLNGPPPQWAFRLAESVTVDNTIGVTHVTWAAPLVWQGLPASITNVPAEVQVLVFRQRAFLFGYNAPDWLAMSDSVRGRYLGLDGDPRTDTDWPGMTIQQIALPPLAQGNGTGLRGEYFNSTTLTNSVGSRLDPNVNFIWTGTSPMAGLGTENYSVRWSGFIRTGGSGTYQFQTNSDDGVRLWIANQLIIDKWTVHGAEIDSGSIPLSGGSTYALTLEYFQAGGAATIQLSWQPPGETAISVVPTSQLYPPRDLPKNPPLYLDALYPQILAMSWLVLSAGDNQAIYQAATVAADSRNGFTLSAKTTRINVIPDNLLTTFNQHVRDTVVFAVPERLSLAERPRTDAISGNTIELDSAVEAPPPGRTLLVCGTPNKGGPPQCKLAVLKATAVPAGRTVLTLADSLGVDFDPATVTVFANVAAATQGESTGEVLGGGTSQAFQRFTLRQIPVTFTSAATPDGAASTLQVWVNGIKWAEVPALYGAGPRDRVYVTRRDEAQKTTVQFGDGQSGARLPTGRENVRAVYRKGLGRAGLVKAGQLSLLMTRPLGLKAVSNPVPATGAEDPQTLENARTNAPLTVLTLDRVVSLRDYEDFARAFAGISKAQAEWIWDGHTRGVFVTVAGPRGDPLPADGAVMDRLRTALQQARDRLYPIHLKPTLPISFRVAAGLTIAPDRLAADVVAQARAALQGRFAFEARAFGQAVTLGELVATLQAVAGVVAVNVKALYRTGDPAALNAGLSAAVPRPGQDLGSVQPAEVLMLDPDTLAAVEVTP
jgi:predicted phage baseplate assembly protein